MIAASVAAMPVEKDDHETKRNAIFRLLKLYTFRGRKIRQLLITPPESGEPSAFGKVGRAAIRTIPKASRLRGPRSRGDSFQSVCVGAGFPLSQQQGKEERQEPQDGEYPHAQSIAVEVVGSGMADVVGLADGQVEDEEADLLQQTHERVGRTQAMLVDDVG